MKETKKFDNWMKMLSVSIIAVIVLVFVLIVSNTHVAKGTYAELLYNCYEVDGAYYWFADLPTNLWGTQVDDSYCSNIPKPTQAATAAPSTSTAKPVEQTGCYSCNSGVRYLTAGSAFPTNDACNTSAPVSGYSPDGNSGYCSHTTSTNSPSGSTSTSLTPNKRPANCMSQEDCNSYGKECKYGYTGCSTKSSTSNGYDCYEPPRCNDDPSGTGSSGGVLCYCNSCVDGSWVNKGLAYTDKAQCDAIDVNRKCEGTNAVTSWGNIISKNGCPSGNSGGNNSGNGGGGDSATGIPTTTPTNNSNNTNTSNNPQTGTVGIIIAWVVGLSAIVYSLWYFKKSSSIN